MRDIENTKNSIRVDTLTEADRKKLFDDFKKAGGEVITDKARRMSAIAERNVKITDKANSQEERRRFYEDKGEGEKNVRSVNRQNAGTKGKSSSMSLIQRFLLRFRLRVMGVCKPGCMFFTRSFLDDLNGEYGSSLLEIRLQFIDIFKKNLKEGKRVTDLLDKQNTLFFDLLELSAGIYPQIFADGFTFANTASTASIREPLMQLHRKLFLLYAYENTLFSGWLLAVESAKNRDKEMYPTVALQRKKIGNALYLVFHKLYPRLHWLMCLYSGKYISMNDTRVIEDLLKILPVEKPGFYGAERRNAFAEESALPNTSKPEEQSKILDADTSEGLQLIANIDYKTLRKLFDPKGNYDFIGSNNKILLAYLLFTEFITEYSFVLNTNKIKFNTLSENGLKSNYASNLRDMYYEIDKILRGFADYADMVAAYNKINREKPYSESQYLSYSKRMQEVIYRREQAGKEARMAVKAYFERVRNSMQFLSDDMDNNGIIIQNPQEAITMDDIVEGKKKLNGKKVYEAVHILKCFADACIYRMGPKGDLFGSDDINAESSSSSKAPSAEDVSDMEKLDESKSVLGQLDDIL